LVAGGPPAGVAGDVSAVNDIEVSRTSIGGPLLMLV
jgi:hypothetical protein